MNRAGEKARRRVAGAPGFSLVEVVIAIAVIAVTFIGLVGLLGLGVANDQTSSQQTVANDIASSILADLRCTPANVVGSTAGTYQIGTSSRYGLSLLLTETTGSSPLSGVTPVVLYFDNSPIVVQTGGSAPPSATYKASIYMVQLSHVGNGSGGIGTSQYNDMVRVVVSWPAQTTTVPAGNVDVISQFQLR
jgi:prepilin-type N-terminal cleavage/methylation domain-containing protein